MKQYSLPLMILGFILLLLLGSTLYTVQEGQRGLVLRLGELSKDANGQVSVKTPGLHVKLPLITQAKLFDTRLQTLDVDSSRILTEEQKYVLVDYFVKWRISDLPLFYTRTGGQAYQAMILLRQKSNDALRAAFGQRTIKEVISGDRANIMILLKKKTAESAKPLGIEVTDLRIKGIELPSEVRESVYQRMRTQRQQVATKHRSRGKADAMAIKAQADASVAIKIAQARVNAQEVRASGDRAAANIYIEQYQKSPKFYAFYQSLSAYQQVFHDRSTMMVMKPDGKFFKYFKGMGQLD